MGVIFPKMILERLKRERGRWFALRQALVGRILSGLYGGPVQVSPRGFAGLAAAAVFWFMQDGQRQVVMVRNPKAKDNRARLVSCLGVGTQGDMVTALRHAVELQLGTVFARSIDKKLLAMDRVASAPLYTYVDEVTGVEAPVQVLAWAVQISPLQIDLIETGEKLELVLATDALLDGVVAGQSVSPTHRAIWHSVARHLPRLKPGRVRGDGVEEVSLDPADVKKGNVRTLH